MTLLSKREIKNLRSNNDISIRGLCDLIAERNLGAIAALYNAAEAGLEREKPETDISQPSARGFRTINALLYLRDVGAFGDHLWLIFTEICDRDPDKLLAFGYKLRDKKFTRQELIEALTAVPRAPLVAALKAKLYPPAQDG